MVKVHLWRGTGFFGWAIRWRTWGSYAHVAIQVGHTLYEAREGKGVISTDVREGWPSGQPTLSLCPEVSVSEELKLHEWCSKRVGAKYDVISIVAFLFRFKELRMTEDEYFCSEYVAEAFEHIGKPLFLRTDAHKISPAAIATSLRMENECTEQ